MLYIVLFLAVCFFIQNRNPTWKKEGFADHEFLFLNDQSINLTSETEDGRI